MRSVNGISSTLGMLALVISAQAAAQQPKKPNIVILATGGTIAGAAATGTQAGYTSGAVSIDAMLKAVPGATDLANVKGEQIANVGSQDMSFEVMLKVAKRINELLPSPDVDGIVATEAVAQELGFAPAGVDLATYARKFNNTELAKEVLAKR